MLRLAVCLQRAGVSIRYGLSNTAVNEVVPRPQFPSRWPRGRTLRVFGTSPLRLVSSQEIQLRPYQEESIQAVLDHVDKGQKRLAISLATGSGKTVVFSHLLDRLPSPVPQCTRTLILAHRRELVEQAARHCRDLYPDRLVDVEMGPQNASGTADITIASIQSITSGDRLTKYWPELFKLIIVDEVHHIVAPTYLSVLRHFNLLDEDADKRGHTALVGVSATLSRPDGLALGSVIDNIVYHRDYVDMIEDKWLADAKVTTVRTGTDLSKVRKARGELQLPSLSKAVNKPETNELTVRSWLEVAGGRKSTLVFCVDVAHVYAMVETFRARGMDARLVTGKTPTTERAETVAAFKAGEFPVLVNCGIFTEGTDIPNIDCVLLARPTASRNLLVQMIGRGLRKSEGKLDCHIIDMVSSLAKGVVTTPTLFGLDPEEIVKHASPQDLQALKERQEKERLEAEKAKAEHGEREASGLNEDDDVEFEYYDSVMDLIANTQSDRHIRQMSQFSWVATGHGQYVLPDHTKSYLTIKRQHDDFMVLFTRKLPKTADSKSPFARPTEIALAKSLEAAVQSADTYAKNKFQRWFILARATWRNKPASRGQLDFLQKLTKNEHEVLDARHISKGRAADMLTKLTHGAKGEYQRMQARKSKEERVKTRNEAWEESRRRPSLAKLLGRALWGKGNEDE